jgi:mannose-6-phosphate isomerase-like protein (cupin superfamily)
MRHVVRLLVCSMLAASCADVTPPLSAQAPVAAPLPDIVFADEAEVRKLVAQAKSQIKEGQAMAPPVPLVRASGYRALVEYRTAPTPASSHDNDAEIMVVLEGSGTLIIGGTLTEPKRPNPVNWNGSGIAGGTPHPLSPGAFLFVPKGVPHYFAQIGSGGLSIMTMHIPTKP